MKAFLDTNILIYAQEDSPKGDVARGLLEKGGSLSVQVLNEFAAVSARKLGRSWPEIADAIGDVLDLVDPPIPLSLEIHGRARALAEDLRFSFYDALIVAAALEAGGDTLYSEDMQHGRTIHGLAIVNPFAGIGA